MSYFGDPTQFEIGSITIDGNDIVGLFSSISIYEDIYRPCITGQITITDSDGANFITEKDIQFIEPVQFQFRNANGESLQFTGFLNGLRNEYMKGSIRFYCIDFTSESVRKNETKFVTKAFKEATPEDIVTKMVREMGGKLESKGRGVKMNYVATRKRPADRDWET